LENSKILEIGSGSYGITPYLKKPITGVDFDFSEPETPLLRQVKGTGDKLPFKNNEFEICILSDVLEHIPENKREKTLEEAVRVASKMVIISGPFGKEAAQQDKYLAHYSFKKLGSMHYFFIEHLKYGLPETKEVERILKKNKKVKDTKIVGRYFNLRVRKWLMKRFISRTKLGYYFYLKGLMLIVPMLRGMNSDPCYRRLIEVELK